MSELREPLHRVDPRARTMWRIECAVGGALPVIAILVTALLWTEYAARWAILATAIVLAVGYAVVVPQWRFLVHRWEVSDAAVYTQRGWWSRERRIAPLSRVQTVDLAQGVLARLLGLATVTVTTASAAGPLRIDGLDLAVAHRLSEELTAKADLVEGDAT